ncbi:unnamed protein product [Pleuronectes platessa]|uniref:3-ketoacyl-[acyl-carrier-protein] reductase beta subunit n=1 Tax=Pleuronectes platessa TaxID=8262 RepID=A0A9N7YCN7_PLEPL|nr:unnamed protein product [Pleuronectes platessa]
MYGCTGSRCWGSKVPCSGALDRSDWKHQWEITQVMAPGSRLAVVCGGSGGIGRAVSRLLAERGCRVAVVSRNEDAARATVASLHGADHVALSCDVSKEQEVQKTFDTIQKTSGNICYLVNAAGINRDALLLRTKPEDMLALLHTNLLGTMLTCRAALRSMLHTQGAAIVNIGSVVGLKGNAGQCVYSASKAGLEGFTRSLAKEVASRNVRVNLLAPGFIRTAMTSGLREEDWGRSIPAGAIWRAGGSRPGCSLPLGELLHNRTGAGGGWRAAVDHVGSRALPHLSKYQQ